MVQYNTSTKRFIFFIVKCELGTLCILKQNNKYKNYNSFNNVFNRSHALHSKSVLMSMIKHSKYLRTIIYIVSQCNLQNICGFDQVQSKSKFIKIKRNFKTKIQIPIKKLLIPTHALQNSIDVEKLSVGPVLSSLVFKSLWL
jgi:hypothetical protein